MEPTELTPARRAKLEKQLKDLVEHRLPSVAWRYRLGECLKEFQEARTFGKADIRKLARDLNLDVPQCYRAITYYDSFSKAEIAEVEPLGTAKLDAICRLPMEARLPFAREALKAAWSTSRLEEEKVRRYGPVPMRGSHRRKRRSRGLDGDIQELTRLTEAWIVRTSDVWTREQRGKLDPADEAQGKVVKALLDRLKKVRELIAMVEHKLQV